MAKCAVGLIGMIWYQQFFGFSILVEGLPDIERKES